MLEKDIESALIDWLPSKKITPIGRQVQTVIGRCDVVGMSEYLSTYVFEVKLGKAPDSAVPQVISYARMIQDEVEYLGIDLSNIKRHLNIGQFVPVVVSESLSDMAHRAACCHAIIWCKYTVSRDSIDFEWSESSLDYFESLESRTIGKCARKIFEIIKPRYARCRFYEGFEINPDDSGGKHIERHGINGCALTETVEIWNAKIGEAGN